jgi:protein SCO1/2
MRNSITIIVILVICGLIIYDVSTKNSFDNKGTVVKSTGNANIGGDFILTDHKGNEFSSELLKGKTSIIYFGFTNCPMICPTALNNMSLAMKELGEDAKKITPVFITTDPERDTSEAIADYISNFDSSFIGLTGTKEQLEKAYDAYKVYAKKVELDGEDGYDMNHSSIIYIMNTDGEYVSHFTHQSPPEAVVKKLREII